jgi:hypothetical protein
VSLLLHGSDFNLVLIREESVKGSINAIEIRYQ